MFLRKRRSKTESRRDRPRYESTLQRDVRRYEGWTRQQVEDDYDADRSVHTIITIGYMAYEDDVLVLTEKGRSLMQNVSPAPSPAAERVFRRKGPGRPGVWSQSSLAFS